MDANSTRINLDHWQIEMLMGGNFVGAVKDLRKKNPGLYLVHAVNICEGFRAGYDAGLNRHSGGGK